MAANDCSRRLPSRHSLIILDDVWEEAHIADFAVPDTATRFLFTTRDDRIVQATRARRLSVAQLTPATALSFLATAVDLPEPDLPPAAQPIAKACGYLPLALAVTASRLSAMRMTPPTGSVSSPFWKPPTTTAFRLNSRTTLPARLRRDRGQRECPLGGRPPGLSRLAIFPDDADVPADTLALLWSGELDRFAAEERIDRLSTWRLPLGRRAGLYASMTCSRTLSASAAPTPSWSIAVLSRRVARLVPMDGTSFLTTATYYASDC